MYNNFNQYSCPYHTNTSIYSSNNQYYECAGQPYPPCFRQPTDLQNYAGQFISLQDYGPKPCVFNIENATKQNNNFRVTLWTGRHFQITLMNIKVGEDIGIEMHSHVDQFIRIEEGEGLVQIGDRKNNLDFQRKVYKDCAIIIPAGKWHNVINTGFTPLKLYSIYAPPEHPYGTIHVTRKNADEYHGY